jgi:hypothetical protein
VAGEIGGRRDRWQARSVAGETGGRRDRWHFWRRLMARTNCGDQWRGPGKRTSGSSAWIIGVPQTRWSRCLKASRSPRSATRGRKHAPTPGPLILSQERSFCRQGGGLATSARTFPALLAELALQFEPAIRSDIRSNVESRKGAS